MLTRKYYAFINQLKLFILISYMHKHINGSKILTGSVGFKTVGIKRWQKWTSLCNEYWKNRWKHSQIFNSRKFLCLWRYLNSLKRTFWKLKYTHFQGIQLPCLVVRLEWYDPWTTPIGGSNFKTSLFPHSAKLCYSIIYSLVFASEFPAWVAITVKTTHTLEFK